MGGNDQLNENIEKVRNENLEHGWINFNEYINLYSDEYKKTHEKALIDTDN